MQYNFNCYILKTVYYNEEQGWGAWSFSTNTELPHTHPFNRDYEDMKRGENTTKVYIGQMSGYSIPLEKHMHYSINATLVTTRKNGTIYNNYKINSATPVMTSDSDKMSFLNAIVTRRQAEAILSAYPDFVNMIINNDTIDLRRINGVGEKIFAKIRDKVLTNFWISDLLVWLRPLGVTNNMIVRLAGANKDLHQLKQQIETNPYILTTIRGIGFIRCDELALKINPDIRSSKFRLDSFIQWFLTDIARLEGDTLVKKERLMKAIDKYVPECKQLMI